MKPKMISHKVLNYYVHPHDILGYILACYDKGQAAALCIITATAGGGVRAPGACLAVNENGDMAGYMSNGCVDADLALQAQDAIKHGKARQLRYGAGSPFKDIRLPCGGGVDVMIIPKPDIDIIKTAVEALSARRAIMVKISRSGDMTCHNDMEAIERAEGDLYLQLRPPLKLHIAGQGAELMALAHAARAAQCELLIETQDPHCLDYARANDVPFFDLRSNDVNIKAQADPFTAFVMLFHDHDWEGPLLKRALSSHGFYIGAMGSRKAHERRCAGLQSMGVTDEDISRIQAPIGLIPAARDANILAISIMAEIFTIFEGQPGNKGAHNEC